MRTVDPARYARRRDEILDAAATVFARRGFDATTVRDIRAAAGIGAGTLFHYFDDKAAILRAVVDRDAERQRVALTQLDSSGTAATTLWSVVDVMVADLTDPDAAGMTACLLNRVMVDEELAAGLLAIDAHVSDKLGTVIALLDTDIEPEVGATWIIQIVDGLYLRCGDPGFRIDAELATLRLVIARFLRIAQPDADAGALTPRSS